MVLFHQLIFMEITQLHDTWPPEVLHAPLMQSVADCLTRWNFFGCNWIFVQTRE